MRKIALNLLLLLASLVLCLALLELTLRAFYPQSLGISYQTRDGLRILRPNYSGYYRGVETLQTFSTNSEGMRDREHTVHKPEGILRIMVLGDSFVEALQVGFEHSFPRLLEERLGQLLHRDVEVLNAGVSGWGTDDELTYLERYGQRFRPELVLIAMTLTNDVNDNLAERYHSMEGNALHAKPAHQIPWMEYKLWQLRSYLAAHSHFYQLVRLAWHARGMKIQGEELMDQVADQIRKEPSARIIEGWKLTSGLLRQIQSASGQIGARMAVFLIPLSIQLDRSKYADFLKTHHLSEDSIVLGKPQTLMKEFGCDQNMEVIDLLPGFLAWQQENGRPLFLKKDGHWNEEGHRVAAEIVSRAIFSGSLLVPRENKADE